MKLLLTICYRLSLFSFLLIVFIFFLFIIGNAQEFLDSTQIMLMNSIINLSVFCLIITGNLVIASAVAFLQKIKRAIPYFVYGVIAFCIVIGILILMKMIQVWV